MAKDTKIITNFHNALDEWIALDPATREDAFIELDVLDGSAKIIDADELIRHDLEDLAQRLTFHTVNPWDISDYDEETKSFHFRQEDLEEIERIVLDLQEEFAED